jgi:hypothetical protein
MTVSQPTKHALVARRKLLLQRQHELAQKRQRIRKRVQKISVRAHHLAHRIKHYRKPSPLPTECWDSVNITGIPGAAAHQAVGSYGAGGYTNYEQAFATFPDAKHVVFIPGAHYDIPAAVLARASAIILDIEPSDATPQEYAGWYQKWRPHFKGPLGKYSMRSEWAQIQGQPDDVSWLADPTGTPHSIPRFDAVQDIWTQNYDHSTVEESLWR